MKAMIMTAIGEPIRIRLHASGVCGTDVHVWHGELPVPVPVVLVMSRLELSISKLQAFSI